MWVLRVLFAAITAMTVVAGQGAASEYTGHVNDFERDMDFQCDTEDGKPFSGGIVGIKSYHDNGAGKHKDDCRTAATCSVFARGDECQPPPLHKPTCVTWCPTLFFGCRGSSLAVQVSGVRAYCRGAVHHNAVGADKYKRPIYSSVLR